MPGPIDRLMTLLHRPVYRARMRALIRAILPLIEPGDRVLDVGCGSGELAGTLQGLPILPEGVEIRGLERRPRAGAPIPVDGYESDRFPYASSSFDVVLAADVLHHEQKPDGLIAECVRVCRRTLVIKDHQLQGPLAQQRLALIDWAANKPYGVPCLYRYNTPKQWERLAGRYALRPIEIRESMNLYPPIVNLLFGRSLQFMGAYRVDSADQENEARAAAVAAEGSGA